MNTTTPNPLNQSMFQQQPKCHNVRDYYAYHGDLTTQTLVRICFGVVYVAIVTTAIVSNTLIISIIARTPSLRSIRNMFIAALAVSDLCMALTSGIFTPISVFTNEWVLGGVLCRLIGFVQGMCMFISTYTLASIAADRYILIVRAHKTHPITTRQATILIVCVWSLAALMATIPVSKLVLHESPYFCGYFCIEMWSSRNHQRIYGLVTLCTQFVIPLTVITLCYIACGVRIHKSHSFRRQSTMRHTTAKRAISTPMRSKNETSTIARPQRAARQTLSLRTETSDCCEQSTNAASGASLLVRRTSNSFRASFRSASSSLRSATDLRAMANTNFVLIFVVCAFVLCWTPHIVYVLVRDLDIEPRLLKEQANLFTLCTHSIAMLTTITNPILYGLCNRNVRTAFVNQARQTGLRTRQATTNDNRTSHNNNNNTTTWVGKHNKRRILLQINDQSPTHDTGKTASAIQFTDLSTRPNVTAQNGGGHVNNHVTFDVIEEENSRTTINSSKDVIL